ncbi:unnamed protein product [Coffea canephora]|uniref:Uncharacterized protein n=1 Tax=Coffea canephora TaxID=49390 RepID=A0A068U1G9_COFCA|nr:unnamed protein product [Coffea canephora]
MICFLTIEFWVLLLDEHYLQLDKVGFVIVSALLVTALLQFVFDGKPPSLYCLVALPLVITSVSVYQKYPYRVKAKEA